MTKVDCRCLASSVVKWLQMRQRCTSDAWMGSNHLSGEYCKILISYIAEFIRYKSDVKTLRQKIALVCETEKNLFGGLACIGECSGLRASDISEV